MVEKDLESCFRYVEPNASHFGVYSDEFGKIILVACSETENALQALVKHIEPNASCGNINELREAVLRKFPHLCLARVDAPRYGLSVLPWENRNQESPDWWKNGYNKIKHDRVGNPDAATFERALKAVAGLEVVLLYLYRHKLSIGCLSSENCPHMLELVPEESDLIESLVGWTWELPDDNVAIQRRDRNARVQD